MSSHPLLTSLHACVENVTTLWHQWIHTHCSAFQHLCRIPHHAIALTSLLSLPQTYAETIKMGQHRWVHTYIAQPPLPPLTCAGECHNAVWQQQQQAQHMLSDNCSYRALKDDRLVWHLVQFPELLQSETCPSVDCVPLQPLGLQRDVGTVPWLVEQV